MKDFLIILRRNFASPIVIAILILALLLLVLNEIRDAWFISVVIIINTLFAIIQEVRAQRALKKLELMSAPHAYRVLPDKTVEEVMFDQLIVGDVIQLKLGDEVPADGEIISSSGLEIDESILTGESAPIEKPNNSYVYAASLVVAGNATVLVKSTGVDTKIGSMTTTLKRYTPQLTPIQQSISHAITWLTYGALGLSVLIIITYSLSGENAVRILKTITSSAVTIVPEGLLLASSLLLAFGSIRLAQAKVLPQKLSAIEAMALIDVLCIDKTGTLTSDKITFEKFELFDKSSTNASELIGIVANETGGSSATNNAIAAAFRPPKNYKIIENMAFSSRRKMSGVRVEYANKKYSILVGAPDYLNKLVKLSTKNKNHIESIAGFGKRVLLVAKFNNCDVPLRDLMPESGIAVGLIILSNELREGVKKSVAYLQQNNVSIRVISGDNPNTVRYIAGKAGITNHHKVMSGEELEGVNDSDWDKTVADTTIFARVLPEQKERLIETFKRLGNFTGMVGDGVNDALAIKKSDLGVAMYAGAAATRRVADIVLLNNSFNSLPLGMKLGNRIMQAIEIIATLFFHKIIYGVVLLLFTLGFGLIYPFEPRHITFMNIFLVTMPTIMWTFFTPLPRHRLSPKFFWQDTLFAVAPIAALSGIMVTISYVILNTLYPYSPQSVSTTIVLIATFFGIYLVFLVPRMFDVKNNRRSKIARMLYIIAAIFVILPSFAVSYIRDFFNFTTPAWVDTLPLLIMIIVVAIAQWLIASFAGKRLKQRTH